MSAVLETNIFNQCCQLGSFRMGEIFFFLTFVRVKLGHLKERTRTREFN